MPALFTHDFFGRDAAVAGCGCLDLGTLDEREAFLLGNQGPDPLFYLVIHPLMGKWASIGDLMHDERPARLLSAMHEAVAKLPPSEQAVGRAYLAGFVCHWLLDSHIHPLVMAWQRDLTSVDVPGLDASVQGKVHMEVERDLDEAVLFSKTNETVQEYRPYEQTLHASREMLGIIDKMYFYATLWAYNRPIDPKSFSVGVVCYRTVLRLIYSPRESRREHLGALERAFSSSPYSTACALAHRVRRSTRSDFDNEEHRSWVDPGTGETRDESFWDLYERALLAAPDTIATVIDSGFDDEASGRLTGNVNFEGVVVSDSPEEPSASKASE